MKSFLSFSLLMLLLASLNVKADAAIEPVVYPGDTTQDGAINPTFNAPANHVAENVYGSNSCEKCAEAQRAKQRLSGTTGDLTLGNKNSVGTDSVR